jgi:aminoglycoside phosphotransferase family enzyme/predicted kinase
MSQPSSYSHQPEEVKHIQTHISHVFIASPYVYKLKKPVDFGFLDYSSLKKRKKYCRREVELNRRLTDDVYLGIISIEEENGDFLLSEDGDLEAAVEYAVKMRQLPEQYFLHTYLKEDTLTHQHLDRVADKLADFYSCQQPDDEILKWGKIEKIKVNTDENFDQTKSFIGKTIDKSSFAAIKFFTNRYFRDHDDLFDRRIAEKRIVDGHGDLHLEHVHITPQKVQIYDCIEFNERFRYGDLAADIAYLAMDLDFNDRWDQERYFINQMAEKLEDPDLPAIIDFYKCYRAYVKGKVKSLQSDEDEVPEADRKEAAGLASRYFELSLRYALLGSQPTAVVFMGRVGTGKSTLARHLQKKLHIERFSSDRIRKQLAEVPVGERPPKEKRDALYSSEMSEKTYQKLLDEAAACLQKGESVILDATFSSVSSRRKLKEKLAIQDAKLLFVEAQASDETIKDRLRSRNSQQDVVSDARLEDFATLDERYHAPNELDANQVIAVDTNRQVEETIEQLYQKLIEINLQY